MLIQHATNIDIDARAEKENLVAYASEAIAAGDGQGGMLQGRHEA